MRDVLAGTGLSAGVMFWYFDVYFFCAERALAFPNGWVLLAATYATVIAIAAVTRRRLLLLTGGVGGTFITFAVFVTLVLVHRGDGYPGLQFAILGLVLALPSAWLLARAHGWMHVALLLVVPGALAIWSTVPRKI